jgi:dTDP-4-dehydrorhamnose reductase
MILLLGRTGQVGTALRALLERRGSPLTAPTRAEADLSRPESVRAVVQLVRPAVIVNAAAYTAVDRAESEPELARLVNGLAPGVLRRARSDDTFEETLCAALAGLLEGAPAELVTLPQPPPGCAPAGR